MAEAVRFYLDQHIPSLVARGLCQRGVDVLTAQEVGRCGLPDQQQLAFAAGQQRVMATLDADYLRLAAEGAEHAGLAYCPPTKYDARQLLRVLLVLHGTMDRAEMHSHVEYL